MKKVITTFGITLFLVLSGLLVGCGSSPSQEKVTQNNERTFTVDWTSWRNNSQYGNRMTVHTTEGEIMTFDEVISFQVNHTYKVVTDGGNHLVSLKDITGIGK